MDVDAERILANRNGNTCHGYLPYHQTDNRTLAANLF